MAKKKATNRKKTSAKTASKGKSVRKNPAKTKKKPAKRKKTSATGAASAISHGGFRSELLAQYAFTAWGTAVATPNPQDHGIDLHCTLTEAIGQRLWAKSPYTVQVKSNTDAWVFDGAESVRWLVEHPLPLFLCVVDKSEQRMRLYQTTPRFNVWALGENPERLALKPTTDEVGTCPMWDGSCEFSLSAPIVDLSIQQLLKQDVMQTARASLEFWIDVDNFNLNMFRAGIMRFRMPNDYKPNENKTTGIMRKWLSAPSDEQLKRAVVHLAEVLDCLGSQFHSRSDVAAEVKASLLLRHLLKAFPSCFDERQSGGALSNLYTYLNQTVANVRQDYHFAGIDEIECVLEAEIPGKT